MTVATAIPADSTGYTEYKALWKVSKDPVLPRINLPLVWLGDEHVIPGMA